MPRLFTGIEIPQDIGFELELMRGGIWGARWMERENFHITLRFMGDISEPIAREIDYQLETLEFEPFSLRLQGVGLFGGREAHALYCGLEENPELRRLQTLHEKICQRAGLSSEPRKFTPHITLARLRDALPADLQVWLANHNLFRSRAFRVENFALFSSRPSRGGGPYAIEHSYSLSPHRLSL